MSISSLGWGNSSTIGTYQTSKAQNNSQLQQASNAGGSARPAFSGRSSIEVSSASRNSATALLSGIELGNASSTQDGDPAVDFMQTLDSLLAALSAGDTEAAKQAAISLQETLDELSAKKASSTDDDKPSGFIADVQSLVTAVQSGDSDAIATAATTLADGISRTMQGPPPPPPPDEGSDVIEGLGSLLSALEESDSTAVNEAASALQDILDSLTQGEDVDTTESADTTSKRSFITNVQALLDAVETGDSEQISAAAAELVPPMGPPPPPPGNGVTTSTTDATQTTAESSLEVALSTLAELMEAETGESGQTGSTQSGFLDSLKSLFEALRSGSNVDDRLKAVISAYTENNGPAFA